METEVIQARISISHENPSETVRFFLFLVQYKTKSDGVKNMTWQHHL